MRFSRTTPTRRLVQTAAWVYIIPRFFQVFLILAIIGLAAFLTLTQLALRALQ